MDGCYCYVGLGEVMFYVGRLFACCFDCCMLGFLNPSYVLMRDTAAVMYFIVLHYIWLVVIGNAGSQVGILIVYTGHHSKTCWYCYF